MTKTFKFGTGQVMVFHNTENTVVLRQFEGPESHPQTPEEADQVEPDATLNFPSFEKSHRVYKALTSPNTGFSDDELVMWWAVKELSTKALQYEGEDTLTPPAYAAALNILKGQATEEDRAILEFTLETMK